VCETAARAICCRVEVPDETKHESRVASDPSSSARKLEEVPLQKLLYRKFDSHRRNDQSTVLGSGSDEPHRRLAVHAAASRSDREYRAIDEDLGPVPCSADQNFVYAGGTVEQAWQSWNAERPNRIRPACGICGCWNVGPKLGL
jgi:hypothetical protein